MKILYEYVAGLGDVLIDFAYFKKLKKDNPDYLLHIVCNNNIAELFTRFKYTELIEVKEDNVPPKHSAINKYDKHVIVTGLMSWAFYLKPEKTLFDVRGDTFFPGVNATLDDMQNNIISEFPENMLKDFECPVIVNAPKPSKLAQGKTISQELWQEIFEAFPNISFIQIGSMDYDYDFTQDNVIDIREKLPIFEALALIPESKFVLGVDNLLSHASICYKKKGLFMWGSSSPDRYGYKQNINLYNPTDCSPCLYNRLFDESECCQHPDITTISIDEIKEIINKLLEEQK